MTDALLHVALFASTGLAAAAVGMALGTLIGAGLNYAIGNGTGGTLTQPGKGGNSQRVETERPGDS